MKRLPTTTYQPTIQLKQPGLTETLRNYAGITFLTVSALGILIALLSR